MNYGYNKDEIKESLTIEQVYELLFQFGGEPIIKNNTIVSKTICHGGESHKLYYYDNTHLFRCFTDCGDSAFDIFELVQKVKNVDLPQAIIFIANYFSFNIDSSTFDNNNKLKDWDYINNYNNEKIEKQSVQLKIYNDAILAHLPHPRILPWEQEGITKEIIKKYNIAFDPINEGIVIPHYNINGELIGIRERTIIKENEQYGKYRPAILNGQMYNHPLGYNLFNLNNSKKNIQKMKKVIVAEGEKFSLLYNSLLGEENDITVACCGSSLISYQVSLLLSLGVEEIIVGFDKQFLVKGDEEFKRWVKKLETIHYKYNKYVQISFLFDKNNLLEYKQSPLDGGLDKFMQLFKERIYL